MPPRSDQPLARVRELCLALPETEERLSHGSPAFFVRGKRTFAMYLDDHHGDGRLALWCAAPDGLQRGLVEAAPEHYFVPRLDRDLSWEEIAGAIEDAYVEVAPRALVARIGER
jgi:hypothetical protein